MTQEEKDLLFKDLSARLPYHVRVKIWIDYGTEEGILDLEHNYADVLLDAFYYNKIKKIKLYLRPMSSMTEEEKDYIKNVARFKQSDGIHYDDGVHYVPIYQETLDDQWKTDGKLPPILGDIYRFMLDYGYMLLIDFFNSHHIDYRGLIEKGLAIEAPEGMYVIK